MIVLQQKYLLIFYVPHIAPAVNDSLCPWAFYKVPFQGLGMTSYCASAMERT